MIRTWKDDSIEIASFAVFMVEKRREFQYLKNREPAESEST